MKRWMIAFTLAVSSLLLGGCAAPTIRSQVTSFHDLPKTLQNKSYVFERTREQSNSLEYQAYENMVRAELNRLGFLEMPIAAKPELKATMSYSITSRDVHEVYPVVVNSYGPGPMWHPYYGPLYYDPFWYGPPMVQYQEDNYQLFTRTLHVVLSRLSDGKNVYETTVVSEGRNGSLAAVMPYMVRSAFSEFPGPNGVPRVIELKMEQ